MNQLREALNWLSLAKETNWCVRTMAQRLKVSVSTLERYFHEHMWPRPHIWMRDERMRQAGVLLAAGQMTIQQVSIEMNFQNQHHFSFAFKKHHGYPPKEHRKRMEDGRLRMADGGRSPEDGTPASKNGVPRRSEAEAGTRNAERGTRNARIMPARKHRFDEFKYRMTCLGTSFSSTGTQPLWFARLVSNQTKNEPNRSNQTIERADSVSKLATAEG